MKSFLKLYKARGETNVKKMYLNFYETGKKPYCFLEKRAKTKAF